MRQFKYKPESDMFTINLLLYTSSIHSDVRKTKECLSDQTLLGYVAGTMANDKKENQMKIRHVKDCDYCLKKAANYRMEFEKMKHCLEELKDLPPPSHDTVEKWKKNIRSYFPKEKSSLRIRNN